jgi:hypothetical protein
MENTFNLKSFLAEGVLLREEQDLDNEIANLEKQLAILKNKKSTGGGTKLTPEQLQKVEAKLKKFWDEEEDEIDTMSYALTLTLSTLLGNQWKGKKLTNFELDNYEEEMVQSLGYKNVEDFENYTDTIANKVMGY